MKIKKIFYLGCIFAMIFCNIGSQFLLQQNISTKNDQFNISISNNTQSPSNSTVISDYLTFQYLSEADSYDSDIIVDDNGVIHVVWADNINANPHDYRNMAYSNIIYRNYTTETGWSDYLIVSKEYLYEDSFNPEIAIDNNGKIHIVWEQDIDSLDNEIIYAYYAPNQGWSNSTIISDGFGGYFWNNDDSMNPEIAIDSSNNLYVVWEDESDGIWKFDDDDSEIMYVSYTEGSGWSNITIISDDEQGIYSYTEESYDADITVDTNDIVHIVWSEGNYQEDICHRTYSSSSGWSDIMITVDTEERSLEPKIKADNNGAIHLIWVDNTDGPWGSGLHIMYSNYTIENGWSTPEIASDGYQGEYWSTGSVEPDLAIDNNNEIHLTWSDQTLGIWGYENEIWYAHYSRNQGWSNGTLISDGYQGYYWNDENSELPAIAVGPDGIIHIIWQDRTQGPWNSRNMPGFINEKEILYVNNINEWSNATAISDGFYDYWNHDESRAPDIATGPDGTIHVVWINNDDVPFNTIRSVMYSSYTEGSGWSDIIVISDGYQGVYWNHDLCQFPAIAVGPDGRIHVVWECRQDGYWGTDPEIMYVSSSDGILWSNVTVISDGYQDVYWNTGESWFPDIAVDNDGNVHVVWEDMTHGIWDDNSEIMYVSHREGIGWSNVTIISDGYMGYYWNDGSKSEPKLAIDGNNKIHVVWEDGIDSPFPSADNIMYVSYIEATGWTNCSIISIGYENEPYSYASRWYPDLAVSDEGDVHIVWQDLSNGIWGVDDEIMYKYYDHIEGWSNIIVVSDGYNDIYWNNAESYDPSITLDPSGNAHIVWHDYTTGIWGSDSEIFYTKIIKDYGLLNVTVVSDGYQGIYWNNRGSLNPAIASDNNGDVHIVWEDETDGPWGEDSEIFYTSFSSN
ncbi:MAG: exo-alpha-sialidase, partial [Candidatus Lokiarchaeota archaeon]|nr:exo-alpha-sialidase [Candidatus Lokiarchaeota archaeon]